MRMYNGGGMYNVLQRQQSDVDECHLQRQLGVLGTRVGGGMYNDSSSPTLTNVTFSGNSADSHGGGMYNVYAAARR